MCRFINLTLIDSYDVDDVRAFSRQFFKRFDQINTGSDSLKIRVANTDCDCNTALGALRRNTPAPVNDLNIDSLKRKGWTEAKIQRWLADKQKQKLQKLELSETARTEELALWTDFIARFVGTFGELTMLIHNYSGSLSDEVFTVNGRKTLRAQEVTLSVLESMEEDVNYTIVP